jgi:hypothetical protein
MQTANEADAAQTSPAPAAKTRAMKRQAGGRKGAAIGLEWKDFTAKVNSGSARPQEPLGSETGSVVACGAAQPQSHPTVSQQSPPAMSLDTSVE